MPIQNRDLPVGAKLVGKYKKAVFVCEVGKDAEGNLTFAVDGKEFKSPSSAASHVMGGGAVNGWRFWSLEGEAPEPTAEKPKREAKANTAREPKAKAERKPRSRKFKLFDRMAEADADGLLGFWCNACMKGFTSADEKPEACPQGHRADDPELTSAPAPEAVAADAEPVAVEA